MNHSSLIIIVACFAVLSIDRPSYGQEILTPKPPATPRINGPRVYGERPGRPFHFTIPATGDGPITYSASGLPDGLILDERLGRISGSVSKEGNYKITLTARNALGSDSSTLLIKIGPEICLTPPMGWNSWNCFAGAVDQEKVRAQARAMVKSGLIKHGWTYINIDDTWQGKRGGEFNAIQGNKKFPDMKQLCDEIHALGLKAGIYSTPWVTSYAGYPGGSAENPQGTWTPFSGRKQVNRKILPFAVGKYSFAKEDAKQWAAWGFDYLKYDWNPIELPQVQEMRDALDATGRDFVLSLSNNTPLGVGNDVAKVANCWRTTGDIRDTWQSMSGNGFSQEHWAQFARPGHWNDPDMLVVGMVGWGSKLHPTGLTPDEQYTHMTMWCLLAAPLLLGCDMTHLDDFTLSLLTNDEVLAVDQDPLGREALMVKLDGQKWIWARLLSDSTVAVGVFNHGRYELTYGPRRRGATEKVWRIRDWQTRKDETFDSREAAEAALASRATPLEITVHWADLQRGGRQQVRDLWRQKDLGFADESISVMVPEHGAVMLKVGTPHQD